MNCWGLRADQHKRERVLGSQEGPPTFWAFSSGITPASHDWSRKNPLMALGGGGQGKGNCARLFPKFSREQFWNVILARVRELCPTPALSNLRGKKKKHSYRGQDFKEIGWKHSSQGREQGQWGKTTLYPLRREGQKHM